MSRTVQALLVVGLLLAHPAVSAAGLTPQQKCTAAKLKAHAKRYADILTCYRKGIAAGAPDPACLQKADTKFLGSYAKADAKGPCVGEALVGAAEVDACVTTAVSGLVVATTTTTLTGATTTTTEPPTEPVGPLLGIVAAHNAVRAGVGVGPLTWNIPLATAAQAWANACLDMDGSGLIDHDPDRSTGFPYYVGANIFGSGGVATPTQAVGTWAAEAANYDYATNTCTGVCGHYTQVVWAASSDLGCGISHCGNLVFSNSIVCYYGPGGNTGGRPY